MRNPERGQEINIPLLYGDGRSNKTLDWTTRLPENMLAVARQVKGGNGYMRIMPGIDKVADVDGISRGSEWNTVKMGPSRVMGGKLYLLGSPLADVSGVDRTPMAHSRDRIGIVTDNRLLMVGYDGTVTNFSNWTGEDAPIYSWGDINDVCHLRQRFIFSTKGTDTFWISDLEDETKPDKIAPAYRAESMPDGIVAIRSWHDYVVCFGSASIEFFGLTGDDQNVYANQPSYTVQAGTLGRETVCAYLDTFAFITSPFSGEYTIAIMQPGAAPTEIASAEVKKMLAGYTVEQLQAARLESLSYETHKLLIVHLPDKTLVYDHPVSQAQGVPVWSFLKTGILSLKPWRAIDVMNEGNRITVGDKTGKWLGALNNTHSAQYGEDQEIVLYTPILWAENAILADFRIDASTGGGSTTSRIWLSATEDGINYGQERTIAYNTPYRWLQNVILPVVGRVRSAIGFKLRTVGATPATLSRARVRVT
ncbi:DNA stabilization protein/tail needle [Salmonella phage Lumpael]|uniref:DNA stabilization protein/tail needle n=1 Tax=Salmonella phage Lumpael TaxID=2488859 RepID=A0A3G8F3F4_9CAUD|nr:head closure Hc3 [Salmonella phage Lumpael]AZF88795.1 DNA stabilization protein/tail needle [Salmonella phage Lumpael]